MSSCSDSEFMVGDVVTAAADPAEYYVIDYPIFIACLWVPIIVLFMCAIHWTNKHLNQLRCDIYDQQEKCQAYSQTNINKYNYILSKTEEDNASLRDYIDSLETRLARLQSIAPTETTMIRIRDDANANYANLGQRIMSIRTQCINALHELDDKYQLKCDDLTATVSKLTTRLDAAIEDCDTTKTKLNERLDGLIADYLYFIQYVKRDETRQTKCDELTATISNLTARFDSHLENYLLTDQLVKPDDKCKQKCDVLTATVSNLTARFDSHLENYALTDRYVQEDDAYKQVLIGYRRYNENARCYEEPIFCPRYTTDFDKYLGNRAILMLDSLVQLPIHKPFKFADYYFSSRTNSVKSVSLFIDINSNIVANACGGYVQDDLFGGNLPDEPKNANEYNAEFKKVLEYCEKIGVKCL